MQVDAVTVGLASRYIMTVLMADGVTSTAAFENDTCPVPEEPAGGDISPMQLMIALLIVGAIIGALFQQVLIAWLINRRPATRDAEVQTEWPKNRAVSRADRSLQTDPLHVTEYWSMSLHQVRALARQRGIPGTSTATRMVLTGILIQMDLATVQ